MRGLTSGCWLGAFVIAMAIPHLSLAASGQTDMKAAAERMIRAAEGPLAPVYKPLAKEITTRLSLAGKEGVGIDLGSGPGTLIVELCRHTKLHWINADINPYFLPYFMRKAEDAGFAGRVGAVQADA
ncbi:MAG: class I SAM-dependent methyltransferase, partial [Planctomycetota bacterium]